MKSQLQPTTKKRKSSKAEEPKIDAPNKNDKSENEIGSEIEIDVELEVDDEIEIGIGLESESGGDTGDEPEPAAPVRAAEPVTPSYYTIPKPPPELWETYARNGEGSGEESQIVENYIPLVKSIVGRMAMSLPTHVAVEDLYSAGMVGLLSAVRRYDMAGGSSFEAYARVRIRGAIFDELRRAHWLPRSVHDKARRVETVMRKLEQEKGEAPTDEEMAGALELAMAQYNKLLTYIRPAVFICLDSVKNGDEGSGDSQHATVADASQPDPYEESSKYELIELIKEHIKRLPDMQQKVLGLYYFKDLRLREIAEAFGVTESRICQIHTKAILSIRGFLKKHESKGTSEGE